MGLQRVGTAYHTTSWQRNHESKGRSIPAPAFLKLRKQGASGGFLLLCNVLLRSAVLALCSDITIDQFDHGHIGIVAITDASLQDAGVATGTSL